MPAESSGTFEPGPVLREKVEARLRDGLRADGEGLVDQVRQTILGAQNESEPVIQKLTKLVERMKDARGCIQKIGELSAGLGETVRELNQVRVDLAQGVLSIQTDLENATPQYAEGLRGSCHEHMFFVSWEPLQEDARYASNALANTSEVQNVTESLLRLTEEAREKGGRLLPDSPAGTALDSARMRLDNAREEAQKVIDGL